jgi:hypothetical protein
MSVSNDTPTSSLCHCPRISSAAQSSAASLLTTLLTRTLHYGDLEDSHDEDHELAGVNAGVGNGEDTQQLAVSKATMETKVSCDADNCPGRNCLGPFALSVKQTYTWSAFLVLFKS